jgi:mono/diheme cytochrome c family protein
MSLLVLILLSSLSALAQQSGEQLFGAHCALCHAGVEIDRRIRNDWSGRNARQLFDRMQQTMPALTPGSLSDPEYLQVLAYMLDIAHVDRPAVN